LKLKLDNRTVAALALAPGDSEVIAWDTALPSFGFRLRRRPSGGTVATWVVQYRTDDGRSPRMTLGGPDRLNTAQARAEARRILARVALGHDPQAEKQAKRLAGAHTWLAATGPYLKHKRTVIKEVSVEVAELYLIGPYFKPLHSRPLASVTSTDLATRLTAIADDHSVPTMRAARKAASAFLTWAVEERLIPSNPIVGTRRPPKALARDRVLSTAEFVAIWNAADDGNGGRCIRLMMLLGCRRREVGGMARSEFDLGRGVWVLPAGRSKNGLALTLPLMPQVRTIIDAVPHNGRDQLFGQTASGFTGWSVLKADLDRALGDTVRPWQLRDIRRTVATMMGDDLGIDPFVIECVLNHISGHKAGVAGIYNRSKYLPQIRQALVRWGEHVERLVERRDAKIIPLRA
jgi:integrase